MKLHEVPISLHERVGRDGLAAFTVDDLLRGGTLAEVMTERLNQLDASSASEREVEGAARLLLAVLRETLAGHYHGLSALAFARCLLAADHFLRVRDSQPDTHMSGYADDAAIIRNLSKEFRAEFETFQNWQRRMEAGG